AAHRAARPAHVCAARRSQRARRRLPQGIGGQPQLRPIGGTAHRPFRGGSGGAIVPLPAVFGCPYPEMEISLAGVPYRSWTEVVPMSSPSDLSQESGNGKDRRAWVRYHSKPETPFFAIGEQEVIHSWKARVRDVSQGGLSLLVTSPFEIGSVVDVELSVPGAN